MREGVAKDALFEGKIILRKNEYVSAGDFHYKIWLMWGVFDIPNVLYQSNVLMNVLVVQVHISIMSYLMYGF